MKKFVAVSLSVLMMISSVSAETAIGVKLNDNDVKFENQQPVIVDGRTLIPLRSVFNDLGYEISWDANTKTATLASDTNTVVVTANSGVFTVNGEEISLDTPAQIIGGSMMLPLRAIGEGTGLSVEWNSETKQVTLKSKETQEEVTVDAYTVSDEMKTFYDQVYGLSFVATIFGEAGYIFSEYSEEIYDGISGKTLMKSDAVKKIDESTQKINNVYKVLDEWKCSENFKTAKAYLLNVLDDLKKLNETDKNYYSGIYPNDDNFFDDYETNYSKYTADYAAYLSEYAKINNQYSRTMYNYFDTEKDTDENKVNIEAFCDAIEKIDEKYPLPPFISEDDEDKSEDKDEAKSEDEETGTFMTDNAAQNAAIIRESAEKRLAEYKAMEYPENCKQRLDLIILSVDVLNDMANRLDVLEKNSDDTEAQINFELGVSVYDMISSLASDGSLKPFIEDGHADYDFGDLETDTEFKNVAVDSENVSEDTKSFAVDFYYLTLFGHFEATYTLVNQLYFDGMDELSTQKDSMTYIEGYFDEWKEFNLEYSKMVKAIAIPENEKDLKAKFLNTIDLYTEFRGLIRQYMFGDITEGEFNYTLKDLEVRVEAGGDSLAGESQRLVSSLENYLYDNCYFDDSRTQSAELKEFGKKIKEINDKYPMEIDLYKTEDDGDFDAVFLKKVNENLKKINYAIENRESEYAKLEVPESCKKMMEIIYAADDLVADVYKDMLNVNITSDLATSLYNSMAFSISHTYDSLLSIATGGEVEKAFDIDYEEDQDKTQLKYFNKF